MNKLNNVAITYRHSLVTSGFTLVETLLGMLLFSIIALSLYATFRTGFVIERKSQQITKIFSQTHWAMDEFAKDMENARGYDFSRSDVEQKSFIGSKNRVSFLSAASDGLNVISYYVTASELKHLAGKYFILIKEQQPLLDYLNKTDSAVTKEVILTSLVDDGLKFTYAVNETQVKGEAIVWKDEWVDDEPPFGIKMELKLTGADSPDGRIALSREVYIPAGH